MTTCIFLCAEPIIDANFYALLRRTVLDLASGHDAVDFIFTREARVFSLHYLFAVMEAQRAYPRKNLQITTVNHPRKPGDNTNRCRFPDCVVDRILSPPLSPQGKENDSYRKQDRIERWAIDHADIILRYRYADIDTDTQIDTYARRSKARLIDLAQQDTIRFIRSRILLLPPEQQWLLSQREKGVTLRALGEHYGRSGMAVSLRIARIKYRLACHALQNAKRHGCSDPLPQPVVCAVLLGSAPLTEAECSCFEQAVEFCIERFRYVCFRVEKTCPSAAMSILSAQAGAYSYYHNAEIKLPLRKSVSLTSMLGGAHFVICTAAQKALILSRRRECVTPRLKVFDISRRIPAPVYLDTGEAVRC